MLNGSWHLIARDHGPADLLSVFRFLSEPKYFGKCYSVFGPTDRLPKVSAQNKARSKKIAMLLWITRFVLDNLRRQNFHLLIHSERIDFLDGATVIKCDSRFKIIEGIYLHNL